jgi:hypothetical protein
MNPFGLVLVGLGAYSVGGAVFNWDFFFDNYQTRSVVNLLGRDGARVFAFGIGILVIVLGVELTFSAG